MLVHIIIMLFLHCSQVRSYNILAVFIHPGKSHLQMFLPLMKKLAEKGHNVTVLSHDNSEIKLENYNAVNLNGKVNLLLHSLQVGEIQNDRWEKYRSPIRFAYSGNNSCQAGLSLDRIQAFIRSNQSFDIIVAEFFNSDCNLGFALKHRIPIIGISSTNLLPWMYERVGNPNNPAYMPNIFLMHSDRMNFLERVENTVVMFIHTLYYDYIINKNDQVLIKKYFGHNLPSLHEAMFNTSLILVNSHFSLHFSKPLVPNIIEVGGLHIGLVKRLPQNIEKWIDESTEGVIYFSLGSMIKGHTFPEDKRQEFLRAFRRLPQRVLWKWENETMNNKPDNVMINKWMPQFDVLCHPNVKAFIAHGGLLGTIEAVHCGVPVIVMPQFGDQFTNARALEANGGGVILHLKDATEELIYKKLKTVLSPKFRQQAKDLSERFRDRPLPPLDTAIYWVEYVARHKGAPHMRTAAVNMPFYQYYLLDVISFLLLVVGSVLYTLFYVGRLLLRKLLKHNAKQKTE
ncbi:UDP-glycosyltransferase UGT5-like isoform X1 [Aethina tumida]|uniref:UDP-glycosyltransferase UGT5-like isoform X1 n=1 Tax=Aethina tumida TaxID=116153 RepID=UPI002147E26B|nr:UDP-glycosyltransferase UGT5-like isoform X1 [Aethina tumida]